MSFFFDRPLGGPPRRPEPPPRPRGVLAHAVTMEEQAAYVVEMRRFVNAARRRLELPELPTPRGVFGGAP